LPQLKGDIEIRAPRERVWEVLADLSAVQHYNPMVKSARYASDQRLGIGASRRCELAPMGSIQETAIRWDEGAGYTLKLHGGHGMPPFRTATARFEVTEAGAGTARASFAMDYELKYGPLGWMMDRLMVRAMFGRTVVRVLAGLKEHVEAGDENPAEAPPAAARAGD